MKKYPLAKDCFEQDEIAAAIDVLKSGKYTMGAKVREFETELARWMGVKHAIMVNSGSSANLLVAESLVRRSKAQPQLKPGDEVLVPALAWPTTVWPLVQMGLVPVYVDADPKTLAISLESAESALSPKTKGMFLIHVLGLSAEMDAVTSFCKKHWLTLIEDCCESFGAFYREKTVGSFGIAGTFSHFFSHHLTTMEGGTITTNDADLADDLKSFRAHGWIRDRSDKAAWLKAFPEIDERFFFVTTGYNVRPLEIEAAVGLVQLKRMPEFLQGREKLARQVLEWISKSCPWIRMLGSEYLNRSNDYRERRHSWMNLPFLLTRDAPTDVRAVRAVLEECGVETRPIIAGNLVRHPANQKIAHRAAPELKFCDELFERGFMIGCHPIVDHAEAEILGSAFRKLGEQFS